MGLLCQLQLSGHGINGVHDIIITRKIKLLRRLRRVKSFIGVNACIRVDLMDALLRHIYLILPHSFPRSKQLTVQVGQAYPVVINQIQRANTAACQSLHSISTHAANSKHGDPRVE